MILLSLSPVLLETHSQAIYSPGHLLFSKEEGTGPLALVSVTGSIDGQRKSPFPKEQEQQPRQRKQSMKVESNHNRNTQVQKDVNHA